MRLRLCGRLMSSFFCKMLEQLKKLEDRANSIVSTLTTCLTQAKRRFFKVDIEQHEEKRVMKRKRDNKLKDEKDKNQRLLGKCIDVLKKLLSFLHQRVRGELV